MTKTPDRLSLSSALDQNVLFLEKIRSLKTSLSASFDWYPYESLSNLLHISKLLREIDGDLIDYLPNRLLMDIGCGDGEIALYFESIGFTVDAIDFAPSNHNGLQGARALIDAIGSRVRLHDVDLDRLADLPVQDAGLALCLGLLYHLKNPYGFMERLAHSCHYCILSTRLLSAHKNAPSFLDRMPIAYLLDASELNSDDSNYWLFTEAGLIRLLNRSGWVVLASSTFESTQGEPDASPCVTDKRVYMLLASKVEFRGVRLLKGWHCTDRAGWRWTAPVFSFMVVAPATPYRVINIDAYFPPGIYHSARLVAAIEGAPAVEIDLDQVEFTTVRIPVPTTLDGRTFLTVECSLSRPIRMEPDKRALGLLVGSVYCTNE